MKLYVLVRKDLSKSQQAVQACHAVAEFMLKYKDDLQVQEWANNSKTMVLLGVQNEEDLYNYYKFGKYAMFYEPDIISHTALAIIPEDPKQFDNLKLL